MGLTRSGRLAIVPFALVGLAIGCGARQLVADQGGLGGSGGESPDAGPPDSVQRDATGIELKVCSGTCGACPLQPPCVLHPNCGDGWRDADEACDDGNLIAGDGCAACDAVESGWRCPAPGQRCVPICGDGRVVGPEQCDDGDTIAGDGCSETCITEGTRYRCGDWSVDGAEECDFGSNNTVVIYGGCTNDCHFGPFCGDGQVNGLEECDLGDGYNVAVYGDRVGCASNCRHPPFCGDGRVDAAFGEQCEQGFNDGPTASCSRECRLYLQ
jgi:cysteine-rich repeat protein